jgi:hypothetical protein
MWLKLSAVRGDKAAARNRDWPLQKRRFRR